MHARLRARRDRARPAAVAAGLVLAGLAVAGCAHQAAGARRATLGRCAAAATATMKRHVPLAALPAACQGLTGNQLRSAADAATRAMARAGLLRGKDLMRARRSELSPLLPNLGAVPAGERGLPGLAAQAGVPPFRLLALAAWLVTVGLGLWMMARWITRSSLRRALPAAAGSRPVMNFAHLGLAVAGLAAWISFLATGVAALAWTACLFEVPVTGLGMVLLLLRLPTRAVAPAADSVLATPTPAVAAPSGRAAGTPGQAQDGGSGRPAPARPVTGLVAAHVGCAVLTLLFTLMATVGAG